MRSRTRALAASALLVGLVAAVWVGARDTPGKHQPDRRSFAYFTARALVVRDGDRVVAKVARVFDESNADHNRVLWTASGRHIAVLTGISWSQDAPDEETLVSVDVTSGRVRRLPCPRCSDIAAIGQDTILAKSYTQGNHPVADFTDFDLARGVRQYPAPDPPAIASAFFLASSPGLILTHEGGFFDGEYRQQLHVEQGHGHVADLGTFPSNDYMPAAIVEGNSIARIAVGFRENPGECIARFPITIFTKEGGNFSRHDTDMTAAAAPEAATTGVPSGVEVNDITWGPDGHAYATIASWTCDEFQRAEDEKMVTSHRSQLWRLDGAVWHRVAAAPVTAVSFISTRERLELSMPDCIGGVAHPNIVLYCNTGTLYLRAGGARVRVAAGVIGVVAAPVRIRDID